MGGTPGNVVDSTGYACMLKNLVTSWRAAFSGGTPGTTDPLFPVGIATMHYGSAEGSPQNVAGSNWAHTANHGVLPNDDLPNTFLAQNSDIGDPWVCAMTRLRESLERVRLTTSSPLCLSPLFPLQDCPGCNGKQACCVPPWVELGPTCYGDYRGQWDDRTPGLMGGIHARTKFEMGKRFAHAAYYGAGYGASASPPHGPVISGCTLAADASALTLTFNATLLRGAPLLVRPNAANSTDANNSETSMTYVLAGADLPPECDAGHQMDKNGYTAFAGGNECFNSPMPGKPGWVAVEIEAGAAPNTISIDLTKYPELAGEKITAVRHMWGYSMCCGSRQGVWPGWVSQPCPPYSCPLVVNVTSGAGSEVLPAVGFIARITPAGKCLCMLPQICDE